LLQWIRVLRKVKGYYAFHDDSAIHFLGVASMDSQSSTDRVEKAEDSLVVCSDFCEEDGVDKSLISFTKPADPSITKGSLTSLTSSFVKRTPSSQNYTVDKTQKEIETDMNCSSFTEIPEIIQFKNVEKSRKSFTKKQQFSGVTN